MHSKLTRRGVLAATAGAVLGSGAVTGFPTIWAQTIKDIELRHAGPDVTGRFEIAADFEDESGSPWFQWDGPQGTFHDSGKTRVSLLGTSSIGSWHRRRFRGRSAGCHGHNCRSRSAAG